MRKLITGMALVALAIPAAAVADGSSAAQGKSAAALCRQQRTTLGTTAFATLYGTQHNAFGKCVSKMSRAKKAGTAAQTQQAILNATKTCKAERAADPAAFAAKYGTNANKRNAFGKCVSQQANAKAPTTTPGKGPKS